MIGALGLEHVRRSARFDRDIGDRAVDSNGDRRHGGSVSRSTEQPPVHLVEDVDGSIDVDVE